MSYVARHAARVNDKGDVVFVDPLAWRVAVAKHKGRDVFVTIKRWQQARTLPQSRYYWGVVVDLIADYIGESREATHEMLKAKFLPERDVELLEGQHMRMPPSTRLLTVQEMTDYIERIRVWAAQFLGLSIPDANRVEATL